MIFPFPHLRILLSCSALALCVVQGGFAFALDLNRASRAQLIAIKGIGAKTADRILAARIQRPFTSLEDFAARVPGFGPKKRQALHEQGVTAGASSSQLATGNRPTAPSEVAPDIMQSMRSLVGRKAMPAMPMLIRPRPRQPGGEHGRKLHAGRPAQPVANTQEATAGAGTGDKIH